MKNKKTNPLTFFRQESEKRKAMYQKGGYNMPTQNLSKAQDGKSVTYQGPLSEKASDIINYTEQKRTGRTKNSTDSYIKDVSQTDLNPKNSRAIERNKEYYNPSRETKRFQKEEEKNRPKSNFEKKQKRKDTLSKIGAGISGAAFALSTIKGIRDSYKK
jgi:hypothetical protein